MFCEPCLKYSGVFMTVCQSFQEVKLTLTQKILNNPCVMKLTLFYKKHFFSTQSQCCLTFSWTGLQTLLRSYLILISIIILR